MLPRALSKSVLKFFWLDDHLPSFSFPYGLITPAHAVHFLLVLHQAPEVLNSSLRSRNPFPDAAS
jgi:hypothetical protein